MIVSRICREPGVTVSTTPGCRSTGRAGSRRRSRGPRTSCSPTTRRTPAPPASRPPRQRRRRCPVTAAARPAAPAPPGRCVRPRRRRRPDPRPAGVNSSSRSWAASHRRVSSSAGKIPAVAPVSTTMLQIVARPVVEIVATPSPKNSNTAPRPPRTPWRRSSSRITSLASTPAARRPVSSTPTTRGHGRSNPCPAMATATSSPPAPVANMPDRAGHRGVRVRAHQQPARPGEALQVHVVGDPVAGRGEDAGRSAARTTAGTGGPACSCRRSAGRCGRRTSPPAARRPLASDRSRASRTASRTSSRSRPR